MLIPFSMIALVTRHNGGGRRTEVRYRARMPSRYHPGIRPDTGQNETVKRCVADEQQALTQLQTQWSQFRGLDQAQCTVEANIGDAPSYVDLVTCLQAAKLARQLPKQQLDGG